MEELLREILNDIAAEPGRFIAEVVQSVLLLAVVGWAGGKFVRGRLIARREKIATDLSEAEAAEQEAIRLQEEAAAIAARVDQEAPEISRTAIAEAGRERQASMASGETEAQQMVVQSRETAEREKNRVLREASDRLIRLTAETARRYLDEMLSESERRELTQKAILESLAEMEQDLLHRTPE
jgi:F-type H+-transporting ATPase subunit b